MANSEACALYIEQQINEGLETGKSPYAIGKEVAEWVNKLFETRINPHTLEMKAHRQKGKLLTNVSTASTYSNDYESEQNRREQDGTFAKGFSGNPAGRPPKFKVVQSNEYFRTSFTGDNEWYTPMEYIEAAREVMGDIDLDPATSEYGQSRIKAKNYYTVKDDGLKQLWSGRVWLNPPYSQPLISQFVEKLVSELGYGQVIADNSLYEAIVLTHNYTDTKWFHKLMFVSDMICFTLGRIRFEKEKEEKASPTQGQAFFYIGKNMGKFQAVFDKFGFITFGGRVMLMLTSNEIRKWLQSYQMGLRDTGVFQ